MAVGTIKGQKIARADSSLTGFALHFVSGEGVLLEAIEERGLPNIAVEAMPAEKLPKLSEAVCTVDWTWIFGSTVDEVHIDSKAVNFKLDRAGPLTVGVALWKGKPFLSFQPFRPAKK